MLLSVGPLGHSLVETCVRLAAVLLLNGQQDRASQCLALCDNQLQAKVQVYWLTDLKKKIYPTNLYGLVNLKYFCNHLQYKINVHMMLHTILTQIKVISLTLFLWMGFSSICRRKPSRTFLSPLSCVCWGVMSVPPRPALQHWGTCCVACVSILRNLTDVKSICSKSPFSHGCLIQNWWKVCAQEM